MKIDIDKSWRNALGKYFESDQLKTLNKRVRAEYLDKSKTVYPHSQNLFRAFNETPLNKIRIVILGQDPYHGKGQAHGLCFSVPKGIQTPPSLKNIFKEIESDIYNNKHRGSTSMFETDLTRWAQQGVFLLNTVLTVVAGKPGSHAHIGWENFTDTVIKTISDKQDHVVFMLWGAYARNKKSLIDGSKHLILEAPHPSPLSAYRGFFCCKHFSKANEYLKEYGKKEIQW